MRVLLLIIRCPVLTNIKVWPSPTLVYIKPYIYVIYAQKDPSNPGHGFAGPGHGYINIFTTEGQFVKRFVSQGVLNSPWGMMVSPSFLGYPVGSLLVGNFGDGRINVFDLDGNYIDVLKDCRGDIISIEGLLGITLGPDCSGSIYFASGPGSEKHGLVGKLGKCKC